MLDHHNFSRFQCPYTEARFSGTCIKDTWTKPKGVGSRVGVGMAEVGGTGGGEMETTVLEKQYKYLKNKKQKKPDFLLMSSALNKKLSATTIKTTVQCYTHPPLEKPAI